MEITDLAKRMATERPEGRKYFSLNIFYVTILWKVKLL